MDLLFVIVGVAFWESNWEDKVGSKGRLLGWNGFIARDDRTSARMALLPMGADMAEYVSCSVMSGGLRKESYNSISVRVSLDRPRTTSGLYPTF